MKKCYIVIFELKNPGLNREKLIASIKTAPWAKIGSNSFLILSSNEVAVIRDILLKAMYKGDQIYVGKLDKPAAWYGYGDDISNWIRNNQK